jgi:hypothetical protein
MNFAASVRQGALGSCRHELNRQEVLHLMPFSLTLLGVVVRLPSLGRGDAVEEVGEAA